MSDRDKILNTIKLLETLLNYQDEIDDLKARLKELYEKKSSCEADARSLAGIWVKYFEEKGRKENKKC